MYRIDNSTASAVMPTPTPMGTQGYFTGGNTSGVAATIVEADWLNTVQEEFMAILQHAGITADKANHTQVLQALMKSWLPVTAKGNGLLGMTEPANPDPANPALYAPGIVMPAPGPSVAFNCYSTGPNAYSYLANGEAGVMGFDQGTGWVWMSAPSGTAGTPAPGLGTNIFMALSTNGQNLTLSGRGVVYSGVGGLNSTHPVGFTWDGKALASWVDNASIGYLIRSTNTGGGNTPLNEIALNGPSTMIANWASGQVQWAVTSSDRRSKRNLKPATIDALDLIRRLPVHEADYVPPGYQGAPQHWDCALIADEVAKLIPPAYLAPTDHPASYAAIADLPLIAVLVRAVQQLAAEVRRPAA